MKGLSGHTAENALVSGCYIKWLLNEEIHPVYAVGGGDTVCSRKRK